MSIVDGYPICDWSELSGVSYLSDQNTFVSTPPTQRIRDLSEVPSPCEMAFWTRLSLTIRRKMDRFVGNKSWLSFSVYFL